MESPVQYPYCSFIGINSLGSKYFFLGKHGKRVRQPLQEFKRATSKVDELTKTIRGD